MAWPLWTGDSPGGLAWWAFVTWLVAVAWSDFRSRRIGNVLIAAGAAVAVLLMFAGDGPDPVALRSIGMAVLLVAALFVPAWWMGYMGAADVKLALALALWGGDQALILMWVMGSVLAMLHALALLARRRMRPAQTAPATAAPPPPRRLIPYGGYLAVGGAVLALAVLAGR